MKLTGDQPGTTRSPCRRQLAARSSPITSWSGRPTPARRRLASSPSACPATARRRCCAVDLAQQAVGQADQRAALELVHEQLLLEAPPLGDVLRHAQDADDQLARLVPLRPAGIAQPAPAAVAPPDPILGARLLAGEQALGAALHDAQIGRLDQGRPAAQRLDLGRGVAGQPLEGAGGPVEHEPAVRLDAQVVDAVRGQLGERLEAQLELLCRGRRRALRRDIAQMDEVEPVVRPAAAGRGPRSRSGARRWPRAQRQIDRAVRARSRRSAGRPRAARSRARGERTDGLTDEAPGGAAEQASAGAIGFDDGRRRAAVMSRRDHDEGLVEQPDDPRREALLRLRRHVPWTTPWRPPLPARNLVVRALMSATALPRLPSWVRIVSVRASSREIQRRPDQPTVRAAAQQPPPFRRCSVDARRACSGAVRARKDPATGRAPPLPGPGPSDGSLSAAAPAGSPMNRPHPRPRNYLSFCASASRQRLDQILGDQTGTARGRRLHVKPHRRRGGLEHRHALRQQAQRDAGQDIAGAGGRERRRRGRLDDGAAIGRRDDRVRAFEQDDGAALGGGRARPRQLVALRGRTGAGTRLRAASAGRGRAIAANRRSR